MTGTMVLVSTPIGNLGDLSPRAVEALRRASLICCEDTRHSGKLLAHAGISGVRMAVCNEHTEAARIDEVLRCLHAGEQVAVITDAGTPGISDPGARLVRAAVTAGCTVSAVPGPAALVMALVISGLDTTRFVFEGFLPRSGSDRNGRVADIAGERRTIVLYEAPHRVLRTVTDLAAACAPDRTVVLARELTKLHEEVWRGTLAEAVEHLTSERPRGEYVLVLEGARAPRPADDDELTAMLRDALHSGASRKDAVDTVVTATGAAKRRVYQLALQL